MTRSPVLQIAIAAAMLAAAGAAQAQQGSAAAGQFRAGYGRSAGAETQAVQPGLRDANGNLLMVNGRLQRQASYSSMSGAGAGHMGSGVGAGGGSTAIGNLLNVVVQGNWNTVIINSTQDNSGDVTAGTELNGNLNLDD